MNGREAAIRGLVREIDRYLAALSGIGIADVRRGIASFGSGPVTPLAPQPVPRCGLIDEAIAAVRDANVLTIAIETARPHLNWVSYDEYPRDEIGPHFPDSHAFASVIGPAGLVAADDFELGLFLIAPRILYRDHHHAAPELYVPLTGPHRWRFGIEAAWQEQPAHQPVWNAPWAVHATITGAVPFLCIFCWTQNVNLPAKVVPAEDWTEIEAWLERR